MDALLFPPGKSAETSTISLLRAFCISVNCEDCLPETGSVKEEDANDEVGGSTPPGEAAVLAEETSADNERTELCKVTDALALDEDGFPIVDTDLAPEKRIPCQVPQ
ncbi:hypothetical protein [Pseudomonas syringae]|uniref:hypothetical protein n=1 Tax=Pseudomonas syringae TaxID=317 RepID=UPI00128F86FC|nr:hypothetical protein [Pseudomonas syringae]